MNKGVLVAIIVAIFVATGAFIFLSGNDEEMANSMQPVSEAADSAPASNSATVQEEPAAQNTGGSYVAYSESVLADTANSERILFFHAEWCSVCNFYEDKIEQDGVPDGITIIKADYDTEDALKEQYGITVQSTFVWLDENGEARQSWPFANGLSSPQDLYDVVLAG